ncbi:hypothetical protein V9T40_011733 [Parthenolecanium corni]|uniref:Uncharacterized protein n=1 Tax=Parthenolecanium corni TaxID=536013 RepID=A0AAN9XYP3_9HEMI
MQASTITFCEDLLQSAANLSSPLHNVYLLMEIQNHKKELSDKQVQRCKLELVKKLVDSQKEDHSVRVWMCRDSFFKCVASVTRHQVSVGAVGLSHNSQDGKIINVSEDQTQKVWKLPALKYSLSGKQTKDLETVIGILNVDQKETIVKYASEWNKNSSSFIAQKLCKLAPHVVSYMKFDAKTIGVSSLKTRKVMTIFTILLQRGPPERMKLQLTTARPRRKPRDSHCLNDGSDANVDSTSGGSKETLHRSKIICESSAKNCVRENVVREYVKIFIPADREEAICNQTTKPQTVSDQVVLSNFSVRQLQLLRGNTKLRTCWYKSIGCAFEGRSDIVNAAREEMSIPNDILPF